MDKSERRTRCFMGIKYCSEHGKISICTDNECNNTQPNPTQPNTTQTSHLTIRTAAQPRSHRAYKVQRRQDPILTSTYAAPRNSRIRVPNGSPYNSPYQRISIHIPFPFPFPFPCLIPNSNEWYSDAIAYDTMPHHAGR